MNRPVFAITQPKIVCEKNRVEGTSDFMTGIAANDCPVKIIKNPAIDLLSLTQFYSVLKLFTGFATAAFTTCKIIVAMAIIIATNADKTKTHQLILIL